MISNPSGGGKLSLLGTVTLGSAAATMSITGLTFTGYKEFMVIANIINTGGADSDIMLYINTDSTAGSYNTETLLVAAAAATPSNANNAIISKTYTASNATMFTSHVLIVPNNYPIWETSSCEGIGGTGTRLRHCSTGYQASSSVITSIQVTASAAASMNTGSTVSVYGVL